MALPLPLRWQIVFLNALLFFVCSYSFAQTYCTPKYNFVDCNTLQQRVYIYNVILNNRTFSTSCSQAGYAGVVNKTATGIDDPIVLTTGANYNMTVNTYSYNSQTYSSISNQSYYSVWIDYNSNGSFDNDERIKIDNSATFSFTIRNNVAGNYRMRIRTGTNDPCSVIDFGETEDYILQVVPPAPYLIPSYEDYQYCVKSSYTLQAIGCDGGTIRWFDKNTKAFVGDNPASVSLQKWYSKTNGAVFYSTCTINGVESAPATRNVSVRVIPPTSISSNNYNITVGQTATLTAASCNVRGNTYWSNGLQGSQIVVSPSQTTKYTATCFDEGHGPQQGCSSENSNEVTITVNAPNAPAISATKNIVCPNESVTLSASSCTGTIKWSTGASGSSISVSPTQKTDYSASCVINGVEGAKATTTVSVNTATAIVTQPVPSVVCEGSGATFSVSAVGSGNITYLWTHNGQMLPDSLLATTSPQLTLPTATPSSSISTTVINGSYQVKVTGSCGTVSSNAVSLQVIPKMSASSSIQDTKCSGDANGAITVSTKGGLEYKQYRLTPQNDYQPSATFTNLRAGSYMIQVRDSAGCTANIQAQVKQPDRITFTVKAPINAKCAGGSDGAVNVEAAGGNGSFKYSINGLADQTNGQFLNLKANTTYTLKATDAKGCSESTNAVIGAPNQLIVSLTPTSVLCRGGSSGKVSVVASGGNGTNYQYQLGPNVSQSTNTFGNLKAGIYTVTVKDDNGCEGKSDVTVNEPTSVSVTASATLVSCISDTSASVTASAIGGTGPYQYQFGTRSFQTVNLFTGIPEGSFPIIAKDANGCTANTTVAIKKAEPLLLQATPQAASCCTCPTGSVALVSSGGIGQKQYQLGQSGFQQSNAFRGLTPGQYPVVARDETGCPTSLTVTVANATAATLALTNTKNVNCGGGHDGAATVQVTGGGGGLAYSWKTKNPSDSLGTSATVTQLPEGEFTVTVTDSNRCSSVKSGTLVAQNPLPPKPTITQSGGNLVSSAQSGVQWYAGTNLTTGKPVSNATQSAFTPFQSSPYFVVVTLNGCASPLSDIFSFVLTALDPVTALIIRIIPNPISEQLRVEIEQPDRASVRIRLIDLAGKMILDVVTPAFSGTKRFEWALQQANTGTYLLQAETGLRSATERVIVH
jgi:hypothetical protein